MRIQSLISIRNVDIYIRHDTPNPAATATGGMLGPCRASSQH